MQLSSTLPKPSFLFAIVPALDLIALVLILPILNTFYLSPRGVEVTLPPSPWRQAPLENPIVVTLWGNAPLHLWVNRQEIPPPQLEYSIKNLLNTSQFSPSVLLRTDISVSSGDQQNIITRVLKMGLRCQLLAAPEDSSP